MTLVILPGMDGTGLFLDPFILALGTGFDVKVVQYPTSPPLGYTELEDFVSAALPREGPFFILGESFSGPLAVALAAKDSSRLNGLILCASFVRNPRPGIAWLKPFIGIVPIGGAPIAALSYLLIGRCSASPLRAALSAALEKISPQRCARDCGPCWPSMCPPNSLASMSRSCICARSATAWFRARHRR